MRYLIRKAVLARVPEIEITADEYAEYGRAREILSNALAIEEKYEIVITNYIEFEKQMLAAATNNMVHRHLDYSEFFEVRLSLNVRLVNLLTAARLYVDQLSSNVRGCAPNVTDAKETVKNWFSNEYDNNKSYRFMEALRNYVQHRGLPVHWTQHGSKLTSPGGDGFFEFSLELASQRSHLEEDGEFNRKVLAELDEKVDLKSSTRCYVESMSNVHESVRSLIAESVKSARELIQSARRRYATVNGESLVGLCACKWSDGTQVSEMPLLLDWDDIRLKLQERNRRLVNLRKRYVTSKIQTHDE